MPQILRSLARAPLFTFAAVLSLALGIGANAAMFSLIDRALLRRLPVQDPDRLVFLYHPGPLQGSVSADEDGGPSFSYPMFRDLQTQQTPFTGLAASRATEASLSYRGEALPGSALLVSGNYFGLLGVRAALGRVFAEDDDTGPGAHPLVVLTHAYWQKRFGAEPSVLNRTLVVNGHPMIIVGVAQKDFSGDFPGSVPDVFVPITMKNEMSPGFTGLNDRRNYWVTLVARLRPGVTREQAETAINVSYHAQIEQDALQLSGTSADFLRRFRAKKVIVRPGAYGRGSQRDKALRPMLLLMGMTLLVLLIACANVANLQLTRAVARRREVAVRLAIGASRARLVRYLLGESLAIALAGGAVGLVVAHWTLAGVIALLPHAAEMGLLDVTLNARLLLFALAASIVAGVAVGLYPALQASRPHLTSALKEQSGQTTTRASSRLRAALVVVQTAMSVLLLIMAGLFGRTLVNLARIDLGLRADHVVTFSLAPKLNGYTDERTRQLYDTLSDRLAAVPGVSGVSLARVPTIAGDNAMTSVSVEGYTPPADDDASSSLNVVGPGYFRTLGIPLVAGREFTASDVLTAPKVAIVNQAFVRHFLAGQDPIGHRMARGRGSAVKLETTIVGVVRDAKYSDMREAPPRVYYTPYAQVPAQSAMTYYVRTLVDPNALAETVSGTVRAVDPNLPIRDLRTMDDQIADNLSRERLLSVLTACFAGLATLLAALGLYGVLAYNVARRTREIGIRMALGANTSDVRALVVRQTGDILAAGAAAGVGAAAAAGKLVESVLYGMKPWDPAVYAAALAVLGTIALIAAYVPARRASAVDPLVALRYE